MFPALLGPSVARRAHEGFMGLHAYRTWPRPYDSAPPLAARGSGCTFTTLFFTCSLLVPPPHLCICWFLCQKRSPALSSEAPSSYFSFRFQPEQCPFGDVFSVAHVYLWAAVSFVGPQHLVTTARVCKPSSAVLILRTLWKPAMFVYLLFLFLAALTLLLCTGLL